MLSGYQVTLSRLVLVSATDPCFLLLDEAAVVSACSEPEDTRSPWMTTTPSPPFSVFEEDLSPSSWMSEVSARLIWMLAKKNVKL